MLHVFLLRHGETAWNADGNRYNGRTDLPLTENGINQAHAVHERLKQMEFDQVYSSPLERAFRTAQIVSGKQEVIKDDRLIEVDFGQWEGKPKEVFIPENEALWKQWMADPSNTKAGGIGDTGGEVVQRVDDFFQSLMRDEDGKKVMVFAHNGVNRLYLSYKLGMPLGNYRKFLLDNASITEFVLDQEGEMTLLGVNK